MLVVKVFSVISIRPGVGQFDVFEGNIIVFSASITFRDHSSQVVSDHCCTYTQMFKMEIGIMYD